MKIAMSAGVALALSFLFYDRRDLSAGAGVVAERYGGGGGGGEFQLSEYALEPQRGGKTFQGTGGGQGTHPFS